MIEPHVLYGVSETQFNLLVRSESVFSAAIESRGVALCIDTEQTQKYLSHNDYEELKSIIPELQCQEFVATCTYKYCSIACLSIYIVNDNTRSLLYNMGLIQKNERK